jgi:hypothetical protein
MPDQTERQMEHQHLTSSTHYGSHGDAALTLVSTHRAHSEILRVEADEDAC